MDWFQGKSETMDFPLKCRGFRASGFNFLLNQAIETIETIVKAYRNLHLYPFIAFFPIFSYVFPMVFQFSHEKWLVVPCQASPEAVSKPRALQLVQIDLEQNKVSNMRIVWYT